MQSFKNFKLKDKNIFKYNRDKCKIGFVHIGVGNFHRAHQAYYIDKYMNYSSDLNWGIVGINLKKNNIDNLNHLKERDGKYFLKTISTQGEKKFKEVCSIIKLLDWNENTDEAESILSNSDVDIVTLTITESGYYITASNELNKEEKIVKDNIRGKESSIIFSYLHKALTIRKNTCNRPITLLCCDNIRENGKMLKNTLMTYLEACNDNELIKWIETNVSFPSCVVDRITPRPSNKLYIEVKDLFNINEKCSVMAEPFIQWVIEDNFITKRPKLENVGVQFVKNVTPYEEAKIRILNGGHVALGYFAALRGFKTFDQAINDKKLQEFFFRLQREEIIPGLGNNIPFNLENYMMTILDRFKNIYIEDKLERITMDGVGKFPIFILPTIKYCLESNIMPINAIDSIASWYIFMQKINSNKIQFNYYEPNWEWVKNFLTLDKVQDFTKSKDLWHDIPEKFPNFSMVLNERILRMHV